MPLRGTGGALGPCRHVGVNSRFCAIGPDPELVQQDQEIESQQEGLNFEFTAAAIDCGLRPVDGQVKIRSRTITMSIATAHCVCRWVMASVPDRQGRVVACCRIFLLLGTFQARSPIRGLLLSCAELESCK